MCEVCFTRRPALFALAGGFAVISTARAQNRPAPSATSVGPIVISNVRIFDGKESELKAGSVLV